MLLPIGDDQDHDRPPWAAYVLIGLNVLAFVFFCFPEPRPGVVEAWAFVPASARLHTWVTAQFLHASLLHLCGNMLFLWLFGRLTEERLGVPAFVGLYSLAGIAAMALHAFTTKTPEVPTLGASGAVSGAIGAALVLCPRARIKVFLWFFWVTTVEVPAAIWILAWFAEQVVFSSLQYGNVAYYAHIGGFAAGSLLALIVQAIRSVRRHRTPEIEPRGPAPRNAFETPGSDPAPLFLDSSADSYALVLLEEAGPREKEIGDLVAPWIPSSRLPSTRGVIARKVPRSVAEPAVQALRGKGHRAALIVDVEANLPPAVEQVHSMSWDTRILRIRSGGQSMPVPWSSPTLILGATVGSDTFIDLFLTPKIVYRVRKAPTVGLTRVDALRRSEERAELDDLAREIESRHGEPFVWREFATSADYEDYVFWRYHLAYAK